MWQGDRCEGVKAARSMLAQSIDVQACARCEGKRAGSEAEANCDGEKRRSGSGKGKGKIEAKKRP